MATNYEKRLENGVEVVRRESVPGSQVFDTIVPGGLPAGATRVNLATRRAVSYARSTDKRTLNLTQFIGSQINSKCVFNAGVRLDSISLDDWRKMGVNRIGQYACNQDDDGQAPLNIIGARFDDVPAGEKFFMHDEAALHGPYEGHRFWMAPLSEIEARYDSVIPALGANVYWCANVEISSYWTRAMYFEPNTGKALLPWYGTWDDHKNESIVCEIDGQTRTLEQLDSQGLFVREQNLRRANRVQLMMRVARNKGLKVAYGASMAQGLSYIGHGQEAPRFNDDATPDVRFAGGDAAGNITLNGRQYKLTGSFYELEDWHCLYHYFAHADQRYAADPVTGFQIGSDAYHALTNYEDLWKQIWTYHPFGQSAALWAANRGKMRQINHVVPQVRLYELFYEFDDTRIPRGFGISVPELPKIDLPPYELHGIVAEHSLLDGDWGGGSTLFHAEGTPSQGIIYNLAQKEKWRLSMNTIEAIYQGIRDIEPVINWMADGATVLVETGVEVKLQGASTYKQIDFSAAFNYRGGGGYNAPQPLYITRYKQTSLGTEIRFGAAMEQRWDDQRTDTIRIPGIGNGNVIEVTLKGRSFHIFEVLFPTGVSNQTFIAKSVVDAWSKPGYAGRLS